MRIVLAIATKSSRPIHKVEGKPELLAKMFLLVSPHKGSIHINQRPTCVKCDRGSIPVILCEYRPRANFIRLYRPQTSFRSALMNRRTLLQANGSIWAGLVLTGATPALARTLSSGEWRAFEVVTTVELLQPKGESRIWLPAVLTRNAPYQRTLSNHFTAAGGTARLTEDKRNALGIGSATYPVSTKPRLTLASRVLLKNYPVDLSSHATARPVSRTELNYFFSPTDRPRHQDSKRLTHLILFFRSYESPVLSKSLRERAVRRQCGRGLARIPWDCRSGLCSRRRSVEQE
jgi:hypothetical protein